MEEYTQADECALTAEKLMFTRRWGSLQRRSSILDSVHLCHRLMLNCPISPRPQICKPTHDNKQFCLGSLMEPRSSQKKRFVDTFFSSMSNNLIHSRIIRARCL